MNDALERFYPESISDLGIEESKISSEARRRHFERYERVFSMILGHYKDGPLPAVVFDVGCGSGYGTETLRHLIHHARLVGIDRHAQSIVAAKRQYPECEFYAPDTTPKDLRPDLCVFVESMEHMPPEKFHAYTLGVPVVAVTTPIIPNPTNPFHTHVFQNTQEFFNFMDSAGFTPARCVIDYGIEFTTGERGAQLYYLGRAV